jgi:hypothetical protein
VIRVRYIQPITKTRLTGCARFLNARGPTCFAR